MSKSGVRDTPPTRPLRDGVFLAITVFVVAAAAVFLLYLQARSTQVQRVELTMRQLTEILAGRVDGDLFRRLVRSPARPSSLYTQVVTPLVEVQKRVPEISRLYTLADGEDGPLFITDTAWYAVDIGRSSGDWEPREILEPLDAAPTAVRDALGHGLSAAAPLDPSSGASGAVLRSYAPIFDSTGETVGVVGLEMDQSAVAAQLAEMRAIAWVALGLTGLVSALVGFFIWRERRAQNKDFEERRKITKSLESSEMRFRSIVESAGEYVWECDREARYTMVSDRIGDVLGYSAREMRGRFPWEFVPPEDVAAYRRRVMEHIGQGERFQKLEHRKVAKDGRVVWMSVNGVPFFDEWGRLEGFRGTGENITERRQFVERLKEAKKAAESADRAKSDFLAVMSHEIRTPMNGIIGFANLLANTQLDARQREYVETIQESGEALLVLINDILDFSKIESGHMSLENLPFNLRNCIFGTLNLTAHSASQKDIELLGEIDEDVPEWIMGDVARLRQVLINLVSNAIKFTHDGQVVVAVQVLDRELREGTVEYRLGFTVRDTGIGIPADRLARLFRPFSQADSSTTRKFGGTGLGLAICRRLVTQMGGQISVSSEEGKGSEFRFDICAMEGQDKGDEGARPGVFEIERNVLLVGRNDEDLDVIGAHLRNWGVKTTVANSQERAVAEVGERGIWDCALIVQAIAEIDARETARALRAIQPDLGCILIDDNASAEVARDNHGLFLAGVSKPVVTEQLFEAVAQILSRSDRHPARRAREMRDTFDGGESSGGGGPLRILLAEDNKVNMRVAKLILEKMGYQPEGVENGRQAVERTAAGEFNLVLMDLQMPEMDGLAATREIRRRERENGGPRMEIIALTADAMQGDRERTLDAGMNDYLTKPLKPQPLKEALDRARKRLGLEATEEAH